MRCLNLGCGSRYRSDWENVDFAPQGAGVKPHDLQKGVPYPNNAFDVVYHSHVLEHFSKRDGVRLMRECHRVLKPGGVIRVCIPDLEGMARLYLEWLEKARAGVPGAAANYNWMVLEMFDQAVRETTGGECAEYIGQQHLSNWDFIVGRWGTQAELTRGYDASRAAQLSNSRPKRVAWGYVLLNFPAIVQQKLKHAFFNAESQDAAVGRFRRNGENHKWMYDSYSLSELLKLVGFAEPRRQGATESLIPGWASLGLDTDPEGAIYKPDSIYVEAVKIGA